MARRGEKDFLLRGKEKYIQAHGEEVKDIKEKLEALVPMMNDKKEKEIIPKLQSLNKAYNDSLLALVAPKKRLGLDENSGLLSLSLSRPSKLAHQFIFLELSH
jgi:CHASE3 domain sensor protein